MNKDNQVCESGTLQRPRFSPGLLLEDTDLNAGVSYTRDLTRLMFRSLFGCGVICGLKVTDGKIGCDGWDVTIHSGLALDCMGNPIELPKDVRWTILPENGKPLETVWLAVCYCESSCRPKEVSCSDNEHQPEPTRIRSGYQIKQYMTLPKCVCYCAVKGDPATTAAALDCGCGQTHQAPAEGQQPPDPKPCDCYQKHYDGECDCGCKCCCVVIAKITLPKQEAGQPAPVPTADDKVVRRIRPILRGFYECDQKERETRIKSTTRPPTPPADTQSPATDVTPIT